MDDARPDAPVTFRVLGGVAVLVNGVERPVPGRRERTVLAVLLAARGAAISADRLLEEVWGAGATTGSKASLQVAVSRIRSLLGEHGGLLASRPGGYALVTVAGSVDADGYAEQVDLAHRSLAGTDGTATVALAACEEAGRLWAGEPYAGIEGSELVAAEVTRLEDLHVTAEEIRAEAMLALGRHALVTADLGALVEAHPFRERLRELHALALYRSGRQADALAALRAARHFLADELGVDPSPELARLETAMLTQDPALAVPASRPASVEATAPALPKPASAPGRLVGRESALAEVADRVEALTGPAARGGVVLVSGEAGIGKTRLVTEAAARAEAAGARVLWGRSHEADVSPALWPWVPVVRDLAGANPPAEVATVLDPPPGAAPTDAESASLRTFDAVSRLLCSAASESPVLVVLEDMHWADAASLQLLAYAAQATSGFPVLLLATVRHEETEGPALRACLAALARQSALRVSLHGIDAAAVGDLVEELTGSRVDDELAGVLAERTDGNPFFVIELVRLLSATGGLDAEKARDPAVPGAVQDVVRLRLSRLPEPVGTLLGVASVVGREFGADVLSAVSAVPLEQTVDLLDAGIRAHSVEETDRPLTYRFAHALVRETLYGDLSRTRRALLHAAVAEAMEPRLATDPDLVAEVAHHFALGATVRPELAGKAVEHCLAAARSAELRGASDQALWHWQEALEADDRAADPDPRRRYDILLGLGRARSRRADVVGSRRALDTAVALARGSGDLALVAVAATSFRGGAVWHWREFGTSDPAMVATLEECVAGLPAGELRTRALASLAMELIYQWRSVEADAVSLRALDEARAYGDPLLLGETAGMRAFVIFGRPGSSAERLELAAEALRLAPDLENELLIRFGAAAANQQAGRVSQADEEMSACRRIARRLRHTGADVPIAWWRFFRALDADDPAAPELLRQALERHERSSVVGRGEVEPMARTRLAGAGAPIPETLVAVGHDHPNPAYRSFVAHALAEAGRVEEGAAMLGDPVPDGAWDYASMYGDCLRVDVLAAAGRTEDLPPALARIEPWSEELVSFGSTDCMGAVAYFVGRGLEALGRTDEAAAAYAQAVEINRAAGILPWLRRAERRLTEVRAPARPPAP